MTKLSLETNMAYWFWEYFLFTLLHFRPWGTLNPTLPSVCCLECERVYINKPYIWVIVWESQLRNDFITCNRFQRYKNHLVSSSINLFGSRFMLVKFPLVTFMFPFFIHNFTSLHSSYANMNVMTFNSTSFLKKLMAQEKYFDSTRMTNMLYI